jgi:hypothetical protein
MSAPQCPRRGCAESDAKGAKQRWLMPPHRLAFGRREGLRNGCMMGFAAATSRVELRQQVSPGRCGQARKRRQAFPPCRGN